MLTNLLLCLRRIINLIKKCRQRRILKLRRRTRRPEVRLGARASKSWWTSSLYSRKKASQSSSISSKTKIFNKKHLKQSRLRTKLQESLNVPKAQETWVQPRWLSVRKPSKWSEQSSRSMEPARSILPSSNWRKLWHQNMVKTQN